MLNTNRVFVSMPAMGQIPVHTARSLMEWQMHRKEPAIFSFKLDTYIEKARNEAVVQAVEVNATHLMFIDSDMVFPPDGIDRLVSHKLDIVGGLYFGRMHPKPLAFRLKEGSDKPIPIDPKETGVVEVDFIGTGFLLINMNVFKKLEPPFFTFSYNPKDIGLPDAKDKFAPKGEDVYFCMYAKQNGFKVHCDTEIPLGHVGTRIYRERDFKLWEKDKSFYENIY